MSTTAAVLAIKIVSDAKGAIDGMDKASGRLGKFQSGLQKAAVPAAIAGAAILKFGSDAIEAASRTQQAMGGVDAVFGKSSGKVKAWAADAATNLGLSSAAYGELAAQIGAQLKNAGVPMDKIAGKTNELVKLGGDLAATYGGSTQQAVEALGAALRGEADPAERYGLALNQTAINAELAAKGQDKLTGKALTAAKAQAALSLATEQAGDATGQFARESDSASGSQQIATAQYENAKAALGEGLLPVVAAVMSKLAGLAGWAQKNTAVVKVLIVVIAAFSAGVFILIGALKVYEAVTKAVGVVQKATWLTSPIGLVVLAVIAVVAAIVLLYAKCKWFRDFVNAMWAGIKTAATTTARALKAAWSAVFNALKPQIRAVADLFKVVWRVAFAVVKGYIGAWIAYIKLVFNVIKGAVKLVAAIFRGDWRGALDAVRGLVRAFADFFRSIFNLLPDPVQRVVNAIRNLLGGALDWISGKVGGLASKLAAPFDAMVDAVRDVIGVVQDLIGWLGKIHVPDIGGALSKLKPGWLMVPAPPVPGGVATYAAPQVGGVGARSAASSGGGGVNINVNGALDPEAVARQIKRILANHDRRVGLAVA